MSDQHSDGEKTSERLGPAVLGNHVGWCVEKAENVVMHLEQLNRTLFASNVSSDLQQEAGAEIASALNDATKLLAFAYDTKEFSGRWTPGDAAFIRSGGEEAVRMLVHRYRTGKNPDVWRSLGEFFDALEPLLSSTIRGGNRTLVHELLRRFPKTPNKDPAIGEIADMVEECTMGTMEWSDFVKKTKRLIEERRALGNLKATWPVPPIVPYGY